MRWTWVSTQMPGRPKANVTTRLAVLRPTPCSVRSVVEVGRHAAVEALDQVAAHAVQDARLGAVEADREDGALDRAGGQRQDAGGRVRQREEPRRRRPGGLVLRAQRQQAPDQDAERVARRLPRHRGERRRVPRRRGAPQAGEHAAHRPGVGQGARRHGSGRRWHAGTAGRGSRQNASSVAIASSSVMGGRAAKGSTRSGQSATSQMVHSARRQGSPWRIISPSIGQRVDHAGGEGVERLVRLAGRSSTRAR